MVPLRPLALGEILDGAFATLRRNPRATFGLAAVVAVVQQLITLGLAVVGGGLPSLSGLRGGTLGTRNSESFNAAFVPTSVVGYAVSAVLSLLLTGVITVIVSDAVLGRQVDVRTAWSRVRARVWPLIGVSLVAGLAPYLGLALCILPGVFLWGALALAVPACVLERLGVRAALRRSWHLAVPSFWRVWGIRAVTALLALVIGSIVELPFGVAVAVLFVGGSPPDAVFYGLTAVGGILGTTITAPFVASVLTLLYVDRRMRAEGLDLALAQAAGAPVPTGAATGPMASG